MRPPKIETSEHQTIVSLYVQDGLTTDEIGARYSVSWETIRRVLTKNGVTCRKSKILKCKKCGKSTIRIGLCPFHLKVYEAHKSHRIRNRESTRIEPLRLKLQEIVSQRAELVGIISEYEHGYKFTRFYWQGSRDRSPKEQRFLGRVPSRLQVKTISALLRMLHIQRRQQVGNEAQKKAA